MKTPAATADSDDINFRSMFKKDIKIFADHNNLLHVPQESEGGERDE
jgi:hypothetical protein